MTPIIVADMDLIAIAATPLLGYLVLAGMVALDAPFPAIPGEVAAVSAGALAAAGHLHVGLAAAAVVGGGMVGDHLVYSIGRRQLPTVLDRFRWGRRLHTSAKHAVTRMGSVSMVALAMGRFVPFGRTASAATAGLAGVSPGRYVWISFFGATAWAAWMLGLGYVTGQSVGGPMWGQVLLATAVGIGAAALLAAAQRLIAHRKAAAQPVPEPPAVLEPSV